MSIVKKLFYEFYSPLKDHSQRIFFIDLLRFLAIILMVIYHTGYDLSLERVVNINMRAPFWYYLPRIIVPLFLFSSGMSLNLNAKFEGVLKNFTKLRFRIFKIAFFAALISLATYVLFPKYWIFFGTLHCIASCSLIASLFLGKTLAPLILGLMIQLNYFLNIIPFTDPMDSIKIKSMDYISLYPWLGVFLIGMGLSSYLIKFFSAISCPDSLRWISYISQKSLPIYLLHQIFIYSIVLGLSKVI